LVQESITLKIFHRCGGEYTFFCQTTKEVYQEKGFRLRKQFRAMREVLNETPFEERSFKLPQTFLITICFAIQNALFYIGASIMQGVIYILT